MALAENTPAIWRLTLPNLAYADFSQLGTSGGKGAICVQSVLLEKFPKGGYGSYLSIVKPYGNLCMSSLKQKCEFYPLPGKWDIIITIERIKADDERYLNSTLFKDAKDIFTKDCLIKAVEGRKPADNNWESVKVNMTKADPGAVSKFRSWARAAYKRCFN